MDQLLYQNCVGIDGCKDGWIVVYARPNEFSHAKALHINNLSHLREVFSKDSIMIVDIPIGLEKTKPRRSCDVEARRYLGSRSSTIFSPPCLNAVSEKTYQSAKTINLQITGMSISKQAWFLSNKILEARHALDKGLPLKEGHPECSFTTFLNEPIKFKKKSLKGLFKRIDVLYQLGFDIPKLATQLTDQIEANADDLIDAAILCWTASRCAAGENKKFPQKKLEGCDAEIYI